MNISFLLRQYPIKKLKIPHQLRRDLLSQQPTRFRPHKERNIKVLILPKMNEILVIVVGDRVNNLILTNFLKIPLALGYSTYQHG